MNTCKRIMDVVNKPLVVLYGGGILMTCVLVGQWSINWAKEEFMKE